MNKLKQPANNDIGSVSTFALFERELLGNGPDWSVVAKAALLSRLRPASPTDATNWASFVTAAAPPCLNWDVVVPKFAAHDACVTNPFFDDPDNFESIAYKSAWHGYLRLFQLLRFSKDAWFMTRQGRINKPQAYQAIAAVCAGPHASSQTGHWLEFDEIDLEFQDVARILMKAGISDARRRYGYSG